VEQAAVLVAGAKLGAKEVKARLLQLLQAAQGAQPAAASRKRKGTARGGGAAVEDAAATAAGISTYQAALHHYKAANSSADGRGKGPAAQPGAGAGVLPGILGVF
jgi:hypothetical protein